MNLVDMHTHPRAHGKIPGGNSSMLQKYIKKAVDMGITELGFSDHDWVLDQINWEKISELDNSSNIKIKKGLEIEYIPGTEDRIEKILKSFPLDYCIGSVHSIGGWVFDHPDYKNKFNERKIDDIYSDYFQLLKNAVNSGYFDIIGHIDLIKIFGHRPDNLDIMELINPVLELICSNEIVLEINTNGLNKPIGEIYPSRQIIQRACEMGIYFTLGSDAHTPERVGENLKDAAEILIEFGYDEIITFENRQKKVIKLDY